MANVNAQIRLAPRLFVAKVSQQFHPPVAAVFSFNLNLTERENF
jgi:hypothetical protein